MPIDHYLDLIKPMAVTALSFEGKIQRQKTNTIPRGFEPVISTHLEALVMARGWKKVLCHCGLREQWTPSINKIPLRWVGFAMWWSRLSASVTARTIKTANIFPSPTTCILSTSIRLRFWLRHEIDAELIVGMARTKSSIALILSTARCTSAY